MYLYISRFLPIFLLTISLSSFSYASTIEAQSFIHKLNEKFLQIHHSTKLPEEKIEKLKILFDKHVDTKWLAKFVIGRHWNSASKAEQNKYIKTYPKYIKHVYIPQLVKYTLSSSIKLHNDDLKAESAKPYGYNDNEYIVHTTITLHKKPNNKQPISIDYYLRQDEKTKKFKVFDIVSENISLVLTQSNQVQSILSGNKSLTNLINLMKEKMKQTSKGSN